MIVAIQGQSGSFHEQVAKQWYGASVDILPCTTFRDVFDAYDSGDADAIVTAVENTIYGSINEVYQRIEACEAPIVGEVKLAIEQMLIANPGTKLTDITEVYSHPVALAQCQGWLKKQLPKSLQDMVQWGAGPRAAIFLLLAAKARAVLHQRHHATTEDVAAVALPVLRHRIIPTFNAEAAGVSTDEIVRQLLVQARGGSGANNRPKAAAK